MAQLAYDAKNKAWARNVLFVRAALPDALSSGQHPKCSGVSVDERRGHWDRLTRAKIHLHGHWLLHHAHFLTLKNNQACDEEIALSTY